MEALIDVGGMQISQSKIDEIAFEIINILENKNITYAIAYMILDEVKEKLQNTILRKATD